MNLQSEISPTDGAIHQWCMRMLGYLGDFDTFADLQALAPFTFATSDTSIYFAGGLTTPPALAVMDLANRRLLVVVGGSESATQITSLITGWLSPRVAAGNLQPPYQAFAQNICTQIAQSVGFVWSQVRLIGYSYGGAVVQNMPFQMANWNATTDLKIYTYGAPKAFRTGDRNLIHPEMVRRVTRYDDIAVSMPPNLSRWYLPLLSFVTNGEAVACCDWTNGTTSLQYNQDATFGPSNTEPFNNERAATGFISLQSWFEFVFSTSPHSLSSYVSFINALPIATIPSQQPETESLHERRPPPSAQLLNTNRVVAQAGQASIVEANVPAAVTNAVGMVVPDRGTRWRGGTQMGHNAVFYGDQFVMYVRRKRTLRSVVRKLNALGMSS
jgi:hypothetical protein